MPRYNVEVLYRLRRRIIVEAKDPKEARVEAEKVVKGWVGTFDVEGREVTPAKAYEQMSKSS